MSLKNEQERTNTQTKLSRLMSRRDALRAETGGDEELREMTLESLRQTIHEFQEEIARYDAHHSVAGRATPHPMR